MNTLQEIIRTIQLELKDLYPFEEIQSFIYLIFSKLHGYSRVQIHQSHQREFSPSDLVQINKIIEDLKNEKPIQYILEEAHFYDLIFKVDSNVLIPRMETEELVHLVVKENDFGEEINILDIGTGSGCIAISLSRFIQESKVWAIDKYENVLAVAKENARLNHQEIKFLEHDILSDDISLGFESEMFDVMVSNPPYVCESEKKLMKKNVLNFEPAAALFVTDKNPLLFYEKICIFAKKFLKQKGAIYFEINEAFGIEVANLLKQNEFNEVVIHKDINGKDRIVRASKP